MRTFTAIEMAKNGRRNFNVGLTVGYLLALITAGPLLHWMAWIKYKKVLIENGAAYYDAQDGSFTLIRNDERIGE